jgi:hypothetical protein
MGGNNVLALGNLGIHGGQVPALEFHVLRGVNEIGHVR